MHNSLFAVPFIHPGLALAGAVVAVIPLLIHLINRRRARRVRWAAMGFLLAANRRSLRRVRLEQWLLLLLRTAILMLFGLAVARPFLPTGMRLGLGDRHWHRVLLVDNSLSASAGYDSNAELAATDGKPPLDDPRSAIDNRQSKRPPAVAAALDLVAAFPANDAVSVISMARPAQRVLAGACFDRRLLRDRLESIPATQRSTDLAGGLAAALEVLRDSPAAAENRAVYVISDQAAVTWQGGEQIPATAAELAEQATLALVPTTDQKRGNRAVTSLTFSEPLPAARLPIRLRATVANFDDTPARELVLQVRRDGRIIRHVSLEAVEPGGQGEVTFSIVAESPGPHSVEVRLEAPLPDALPDDDVRHLSLEVFESVPVLLVDGAPGAGRLFGEAGYLAAALAPEGQPGETVLLQPRIISEWELPGEALPAYRLIILCNVQRLEEPLWHRLEEFVRAGGGLLIFLGEAVGRDNYNRFGYADGQGLLPAKLGPPVPAWGNADERDALVRLQPEAFTHPAVAHFAQAERSGLFLNGRIYRFMSVEVDPTAATVLLRYTDGHPAVVERSFGGGRSCLVTTTANMAWNNLAARGDYVSLMWGLASHCTARTKPGRNLLIGQSIAESLPADWAAAAECGGGPPRINGPDATVDNATIEGTRAGYKLCYGPLERVGVYSANLDASVENRRRIVFAANIDPTESNLAVMDEKSLRELLKCPLVYLADPGELRPRFGGGSEELARSLCYLVVFLLVCEAWLAMRFTVRD